MLHFLLHNGPHYQTGTRGLITSSPSLTASLSEMLGPSGLQGSCCNANIRCYSSSKLLCTLCTDVASQRALSIFAFRAVRKIHPMVPAAICTTLFGKQELTTSNIFTMLSSELSTTSQSSTGAQAERITATQNHMVYGGHWLPPSSGASGSSTCWVSCRLR